MVWMPPHCSTEQVGKKRLGDVMSVQDLNGNADSDTLAKAMPTRFKVPPSQREMVIQQSERLIAVAKWIGSASELANAFQVADETGEGKVRTLRDSTCLKPKPKAQAVKCGARGTKRKCSAVDTKVGSDLSGRPRWEQLRGRVRERANAAPGTL